MVLFGNMNPTTRWGLILVVTILLLSAVSIIYTPPIVPVGPLFPMVDHSDIVKSTVSAESNAQKSLIKATEAADKVRAVAKSARAIAVAVEAEEEALVEAEEAILMAEKAPNSQVEESAIQDVECARAKAIVAKCAVDSAKAIEKTDKANAEVKSSTQLAETAARDKHKAQNAADEAAAEAAWVLLREKQAAQQARAEIQQQQQRQLQRPQQQQQQQQQQQSSDPDLSRGTSHSGCTSSTPGCKTNAFPMDPNIPKEEWRCPSGCGTKNKIGYMCCDANCCGST